MPVVSTGGGSKPSPVVPVVNTGSGPAPVVPVVSGVSGHEPTVPVNAVQQSGSTLDRVCPPMQQVWKGLHRTPIPKKTPPEPPHAPDVSCMHDGVTN